MTARTHHRLQEYHLQCGKVASGLARDLVGCVKDLINKESSTDTYVKWWEDHMESVAKALEDRPMGVTVLDSELIYDRQGDKGCDYSNKSFPNYRSDERIQRDVCCRRDKHSHVPAMKLSHWHSQTFHIFNAYCFVDRD
jgi:hypothetical protein